MPVATPTIASSYIQLDWFEKGRHVVITPSNSDRFVVTEKAAIQACRAARFYEEFRGQFQKLLDRLGDWVQNHQAEIEHALITVRDSDLLFLVVRNSVHYDAQFETDLTDLDLKVAQSSNLKLIRLSVIALPHVSEENINSFVHDEYPQLVFGNAN